MTVSAEIADCLRRIHEHPAARNNGVLNVSTYPGMGYFFKA